MAVKKEIYIKVTKDGPYLVFGSPTIRQEIITPNEEGSSWEYTKGKVYKTDQAPVALCRCGRSKTKPFCDGCHEKKGFDGTETAPIKPILESAKEYKGVNYTLFDNELYCAFARFCDAFGQVWNFIQNGDALSDRVARHEACACSSGRLMLKDNKTGQFIEPDFEPSIGVLEDPAIECSGPLHAKGGIGVISEDGKSYEVRNRQTLCRCGCSHNKPFCDGTHAAIQFSDKKTKHK